MAIPRSIMTSRIIFAAGLAAAAVSPVVFAADTKSGAAPDNSGRNQEIVASDTLTAEDQSYAKGDLELLTKIRRAVVADDALSVYAQNVKIITKDGTVHLKGPVKSDGERQTVEKIATSIAGKGKVINGLELAK